MTSSRSVRLKSAKSAKVPAYKSPRIRCCFAPCYVMDDWFKHTVQCPPPLSTARPPTILSTPRRRTRLPSQRQTPPPTSTMMASINSSRSHVSTGSPHCRSRISGQGPCPECRRLRTRPMISRSWATGTASHSSPPAAQTHSCQELAPSDRRRR